MPNNLDFDSLEQRTRIVKYRGKKYTLREASCGVAVHYMNQRQECYVYGDNGELIAMRKVASLEPLLISGCLFDENDTPVPESVILDWESRVTRALYDEAFSISELGSKDKEGESTEDLAKKEETGTTTTSS